MNLAHTISSGPDIQERRNDDDNKDGDGYSRRHPHPFRHNGKQAAKRQLADKPPEEMSHHGKCPAVPRAIKYRVFGVRGEIPARSQQRMGDRDGSPAVVEHTGACCPEKALEAPPPSHT